MGVTLRTVANDGEGLLFDYSEISVLVGIDFSRHIYRSLWKQVSFRVIESGEEGGLSAFQCEITSACHLTDAIRLNQI